MSADRALQAGTNETTLATHPDAAVSPDPAAPDGGAPDGGASGALPEVPAEHPIVAAYATSDDPVPSDATHEIGDGDFRAIGAEFLRYFIQLGRLTPRDEVLDIGCGFGRMALPLARYLDPGSRYLGFDIVREPVEWCRAHVAPRRPGFAFEHVDFHHPLYNPAGTVPGADGFLGRVPAPLGWRPSFIAAVSVFTHLEPDTMVQFLADARSVLRPGGRLFLTAFLTGDGTPPVAEGSAFPKDRWRTDGPTVALIGEPATAAVGVSWPWLSELLPGLGLRPESVTFGHWRRGYDPTVPFQDVLVAG